MYLLEYMDRKLRLVSIGYRDVTTAAAFALLYYKTTVALCCRYYYTKPELPSKQHTHFVIGPNDKTCVCPNDYPLF